MNIFLTIILSISSLFIHDYHFGYTEINYNKDNKSLETSIKLYTEDLDLALSTINNSPVRLDSDKEIENANLYIQAYLADNFSIEINEKLKEATFIGKEYEEDFIWIYLEYENIKKIKKFEVKNSLLFDTFDDQKNISNIKILGKTYSPIFKKKSPNYKKNI